MTATSRKEGYLPGTSLIGRPRGSIEVLEKFEALDDEEWTMKVEGRFEQFMDLLHSITGV